MNQPAGTPPQKSLTIAVLGLGYVGATSMACISKLGHNVIGVDVASAKVDLVCKGLSPILEPQVPELLAAGFAQGLVSATTDSRDAIARSDACLVCVGTPSRANGSVDTTHLTQVIETIGAVRNEQHRSIPVIIRSTALPSVHEQLMATLRDILEPGAPLGYCVHPEFLREGQAVADFFAPPKIVFGTSDCSLDDVCDRLYHGFDAPLVRTDPATAAMIKYAANCYHAVKVTFANEIGILAHAQGVDARAVMEAFCLDTKLNISSRYLKPGMPYGGSCLPKDLRGVLAWSRQNSVALPMLEHVGSSNELQVQLIVARVLQTGLRDVGLIGLTFKDDTDDLRESPMVAIAEHLIGKGCKVRIYDNNLVLDHLTGKNQNFAIASLPHLGSMLVQDCRELVAQSRVVVVARQPKNLDMTSLPWGGGQIVLDLVGLGAQKPSVQIHGLYWPSIAASEPGKRTGDGA